MDFETDSHDFPAPVSTPALSPLLIAALVFGPGSGFGLGPVRVNVIDPFWISSLAEPREEVAPVETGGDSGIRSGVVSNAPLPGHGVCQLKKREPEGAQSVRLPKSLEDSLGREFVAHRHAVSIHFPF